MAKIVKADKEPKPKQIEKEEFLVQGQPLAIKIGESTVVATPREFKTGSLGWYAGEKVTIVINGKPIKVQVGLNMIVVGSGK